MSPHSSDDALDGILARLDEQQLRMLQEGITRRLRTLHREREREQLRSFRVLDRVWFSYKGDRIVGTIISINRRTVSLHAEDGKHWNVSPSYLHRIGEGDIIDADIVDDAASEAQDPWELLEQYLPEGNRGKGRRQ